MLRRYRTICAKLLLLLVIPAMLPTVLNVSTGVASTSSAPSIEGIWSFNGGRVAIHPGPNGTLVGTVVAPTRFAQCTHEDGEEMWTDMTLQSDGSYFGLHHWFYETAGCTHNETLGPTAWRVMTAASGGHYLLVCFSSPEKPSQPTIAPNGEAADDTYGCVGSAVASSHVASLPRSVGTTSTSGTSNESFRDAVSLPANDKCLSRRVFRIHLKDPKYDPIKELVITLKGRRLAAKRHGNAFVTKIDLKGLPRGTFTINIRVTTVLGHHLVGSRTYHTCTAKRKSGKPKRLQTSGRPAGPTGHK